MTHVARAIAHPNIALAKYWGKLDVATNLPAVPSLSLTLDGMSTTTAVAFDPALAADAVELNGAPASRADAARVSALLDRVRAAAGTGVRARVASENDFPTASGLASSASGFAALALAATRAAGLAWDAARVSDLARRSSASAARSIFGGWVVLPAGRQGEDFLAAEPLAPADHWDVALVVAVATEGPKETGSTGGMQHAARTSPYYAAWVEAAPAMFTRVRAALLARDLEALGTAAEHSALAMHACSLAADPATLYFQPVTLAALARVRELRRAGVGAWATIDAGPHVKVLCAGGDAARVAEAMCEVPGVLRTIEGRPGGAAVVEDLAP